MDAICQPPARCDAQGECGDDAMVCVGGAGGQCLAMCPTDDAKCADIHPGLVCAEGVAAEPVCLPEGSFPGSACRADKNDPCDRVRAGKGTAEMVCENGSCLVACANGGTALCSTVSERLSCAHGVFDAPVCLPHGSYPGGPCGGANGDECDDANIAAGVSAKMSCKGNACVLDCDAGAIGDSDPASYCGGIDGSLTCATEAYPGSAVCLPEGTYPGGPCAHGTCGKLGDIAMTCERGVCLLTCAPEDPGTDALEDPCSQVSAELVCASGVYAAPVCLPKGTFPGGPCGGPMNDRCAQDLEGASDIDMKCVAGRCAIDCSENGKWAGYGEAVCRFADASLTCAQAGGSVCVKACAGGGACDSGYSCLDAGKAPARENACLPNGSFPGSACAPGNTCASGPGGATMSCRSGRCLVNCAPGPCPNGTTCLSSENVCLPNGSFLGAPCASGGACSGSPMLVCVPGGTPTCAAGCSLANGQMAANTYCTNVGNMTGNNYDTCGNVMGDLYVCRD
jgi:hypothetical protein